MGVAWLSPLFLIGAASALIPVALHLFLRRRAPVVDFAAMRYLKSAPLERESHRRLKEWLLLALRVSAFVLLAIAFARPYLNRAVLAADGRGTIILLDTSASLTAPGQFERARALAVDAVASVPALEPVGVMTFGGPLVVAAPLSADHLAARLALEQARAGAGATRYAEALARGAELLGGRPGRLVVVTDLQSSGWDASSPVGVPESAGVELRDVAGPRSNLSVDSIHREGDDAVAVVHNHSSATVAPVVRFTRNGTAAGQVTVSLPPLATAEARVPLARAADGTLSAAVQDPSGYAADNARFVVLSAAPARQVAIVSASGDPSESLYLRGALEASVGGDRVEVVLISASELSSMTPEALDEVAVLCLTGTRGLDQRGRALLNGFVKRGGGVLIAAGDSVDQSLVREAFGAILKTAGRERERSVPLTFTPTDLRHPVFGPLGGIGTLALVEVSKAVQFDVPDSASVIARFSDGSPALVDESTVGGRVLLFASDLNNAWNTLPLQPAFAPLVHEVVSYLTAPRAGAADYVAGERSEPGTDTPGVTTLGGRVVAINVDPLESNPVTMSAAAFEEALAGLRTRAARHEVEATREREGRDRLWQYGLGMMLLLLMAEGALGRRMG